jgi:hypothetical protein
VHSQLLNLRDRLVLRLFKAEPHNVVGRVRVITAKNPCVLHLQLFFGQFKLLLRTRRRRWRRRRKQRDGPSVSTPRNLPPTDRCNTPEATQACEPPGGRGGKESTDLIVWFDRIASLQPFFIAIVSSHTTKPYPRATCSSNLRTSQVEVVRRFSRWTSATSVSQMGVRATPDSAAAVM